MLVYHRTDADASAIVREGFKESQYWRGTWVQATCPGAFYGAAAIVLEIPESLFRRYEKGDPFESADELEFSAGPGTALIPAAELNAYLSSARVLDAAEAARLSAATWDRFGQEQAGEAER